MSAHPNIVLVGCGKMGSSLLQGWLNNNINADFFIIEPSDIAFDTPHFKTPKDAESVLNTASMIILAVKPQIMEELCTKIAPHLNNEATILSIAAGQSIANFESYFGSNHAVIRAMPNTPASIGKGMSVAVANTNVTNEQKQLANTLLKTAGKTEWLEDENLLNAVTALSGSGPAYIFHLIETLTTAGTEIGLSKELAGTLARQTVIGAAALAENEPETPASTLRENVTSPGGTTEAALNILMDGRIEKIYKETLSAAKKRGEELNKQLSF